ATMAKSDTPIWVPNLELLTNDMPTAFTKNSVRQALCIRHTAQSTKLPSRNEFITFQPHIFSIRRDAIAFLQQLAKAAIRIRSAVDVS
ncbi:hypothetical protein SB816_32490, partial [Achromobacter sp. SIMBA_011]|uniref:hypothetical protein n=1 Tax=Achromobacter sp. SIMBA_011 TaxID=3085759 RepID=UPI0039791400